jgi:hypothetical protein
METILCTANNPNLPYSPSTLKYFLRSLNMLRYIPCSLRMRLNPFHVFSERMKNTQKEIFAFNNAWGL